MAVETNPKTLRDIYPELPDNTSELFMQANQGYQSATIELTLAIQEANIDRWHMPSLLKIAYASSDLPQREKLALNTIATLDYIRACAQPGQPFISFRHDPNVGVSISCGELINEGSVTNKSEALLYGRAVVVDASNRSFPDFRVSEEDDLRLELLPYRTGSPEQDLSYLNKFTQGLGRFAVGAKNIETKISSQQEPGVQLYSALAMDLAGHKYESAWGEDAKDQAVDAIVESFVSSLCGLHSPDKDIHRFDHMPPGVKHEHTEPIRKNSLQDLPQKYVSSLLRVVGLDEHTLRDTLYDELDSILNNKGSTSREIAGAIMGEKAVKRFVEIMARE